MAALTNNTTGSLKKMCKSHASINKTRRTNMPCSNLGPIVKRKAIDSHSSFAKFMGHSESADGGSSKSPFTPKSKKRKVSDDAAEEADESDQEPSESEKKASKGKKPAVEKPAAEKKRRGRPKKQPKSEEAPAHEDKGNAEDKDNDENSADGGDGLGEFIFTKNIEAWLENTDSELDAQAETAV